jgi:hypothetical protein
MRWQRRDRGAGPAGVGPRCQIVRHDDPQLIRGGSQGSVVDGAGDYFHPICHVLATICAQHAPSAKKSTLPPLGGKIPRSAMQR